MRSNLSHDTTPTAAPVEDTGPEDFELGVEGLAEWEAEWEAVKDAAYKKATAREAEQRLAAQRHRERLARLKAEEAQRERDARRGRERLAAIQSLTPPPVVDSDLILDAKGFRDAKAAYKEGCETLTEDWHRRFWALPEQVIEAWNLYHEDDYELGEHSVALRGRTPCPYEFPEDVSSIEAALADPEYKKFQTYSATVLQQIVQLQANVDRFLNPPAGSRPPLKGWSLDEIDENDGAAWPVPGLIPHGLTFTYGLPKSGKSLWMQKPAVCPSMMSQDWCMARCCTSRATSAPHGKRSKSGS